MWFDRCANLINDNAEHSDDIMEGRIEGDITVCVPNDINCMTSYILKENNGWFEREIAFIQTVLKPGMNALDIGAGYGVYALAAAKSIGPHGNVWAFEPSRLSAAYLARSIRRNKMNNVHIIQAGVSDSDSSAFLSTSTRSELDRIIDFEPSDIKEAIPITYLDRWMESTNSRIDFIRLDPLSQEDNILKGGRCFFEHFSPLILYKIKHGVAFHLEMIRSFLDIGYQSYRLIPGLKILAPVSIGEKLDAFQLNLFCCKVDRAETLRMQGVLICGKENDSSLIDVPAQLWIDFFQNFPYVVKFLPLWQMFCVNHAADPDWQTHQQALSAYAMFQLPMYNTSDRYGALVTGYRLMAGLLKSRPTVSRILTTVRIANDLGYQEDALTWLNHLNQFFEAGHEFSLNEPFLAVSNRMEGLDPGNDIGQWLIYGVLETRELCQAFSSYFTGKNSLKEHEITRTSPFYSDEMERKRQIIRMRYQMQEEDGC